MNLTIKDIARLAEVSKATVSAVINSRSGISSDTRARVLEVVNRFNYKPNQIARSLSVRSTKSIGLIIKEIDNPYFTKIMKGVFDTCSRQGYTVFLGSSELAYEQEEHSVQAFVSQQVDGLIITPMQDRNRDFTYLSELLAKKYPLVMIGEVRNFSTNVVDIRNVEAAYQAVNYLIQQGHRQIAYLAGPPTSLHSDERFEGYGRALLEHGIPAAESDVRATGSDFEDGYREATSLFSGADVRQTAVFCYNDLVAIGVIHALQELGIDVPREVAVIGFDNIDFCRYLRVPLTTVNSPAYEMGQAAAELLLRQIQQPETILFEHIELEAALVKRKSA